MRSALTAAAALAIVPLTMAWNVELPPCLDKFKPFVSSGCFQDGNPPALVYRSSQDQKTMTVEKCIAECKGNGFRYAGLKYYGVCFCGATVNGPQVDDSQCSFPCNGNKAETCGGDKTLSVWQDPTFSKGPNVTIDDYKSVGCYTDDSKKGRTLSWPVKLDATTFTTKGCLAACEKDGYPFAGTEYGGECWCGVVLANDTTKVDDKECNIPCKGDAKDNCGGRSRLSLYVAKDLESLEPCGYQPPGTTTTAPPVTTTATTSIPGETTTTMSDGTTTTNPAETTTTNPEETTTRPGETTTSGNITTTNPTDTTTTTPTDITTTKPEETTTTKPGETITSGDPTTTNPTDTTTTTPADTTTTTPADTTTTSPTETTTKPGETTTTKPTTTTNGPGTTTTVSLCTATQTLPPKCEWKCGNWCAPPLPNWGNKLECMAAAKTCALQVVSCFKYAGWPNTVDCFDFQKWCGNVQQYCLGTCAWGKCGKGDCWNKLKPSKGNAPTTTTSVYPCPPTTTTKATATTQTPVTSCPPGPTNICTQPANNKWGYGPGKPVGGIPLPVVGCNDQKNDWSKNPFKYYTEPNTFNCPSFPWPKRPNVCIDACNEQYQECRDTYVYSCKKLGWKGSFHKRLAGETDEQFERRWLLFSPSRSCAVGRNSRSWSIFGSDSVSCWGLGGNTPIQAGLRCKAQWVDCLAANKWVNPGDKCKKWCDQY
ncbi:Uncharacterized protein TPAR_06315 [Tolypocladium paradoxum]|uniref:WSC domain-containing protein n=1 Tax=Tolypocladium paradoxum TaxID=94208 RepID=A0A2S4KTJ3_9HYPO|nr:Uncharacterized protein TPAR_06315 [Tolypocladium paradoxum]